MSTEAWGTAKRISFRFLFAYLVLLMQPFPLDVVPGAGAVLEPYGRAWQALALWIGRHLLGLEGEVPLAPTGSGDRTIDWLLALTKLCVALVATAAWSIAARAQPHHRSLHAGLRVYVRYFLAHTMAGYAIVKLLKTQFPFPPLGKLVQPLGQSSPMGLLWSFMGYSTAYNVFTGAVELVGAALLLFRRTTTLGALLLTLALGNIVVLNFVFDVPVKLHSSHLLLCALVLAAPDLRRLANVLLLNRRAEPVELGAPPRDPRRRWALYAAKALAIAGACGQLLWSELEYIRAEHASHPICGLYQVEELTRDGQIVPPQLGNAERWHYLSLESWSVRLTLADGSARRFRVKYDDAAETVELEDWFERGTRYVVSVRPEGDRVVLEGALAEGRMHAKLRKIDPSNLLLLSRGFHWVNEVAFNR